MRTRAQAADPAALDLNYLSTAYSVAEPTLQVLIDAPTAELVREFLAALTIKSEDYDALKADKLRVDVELENTVRVSETKVKAQKAAAAKQAKDVEDLRIKLNAAEETRETLSGELDQLRTATSGSSAEVQALRQRIETLEASNRDAFALVERKTTEKDRVATELAEQHDKFLAIRRELSQLEERNQALDNAASSQKFREQSLQQEVELLKRNNEWHSNELQTRSQEHTKFRKERNARISTLQRELEDSVASVEILKRSESTLRQRLDEVQGKADEAFARIAGLEEEFSRKEQGWKAELDSSKRLAALQAQNAATHKARLQEVQSQVDQIKDDAAEEIGRLQAEVETERSYKDQAEGKLAELEITVETLQRQPRPATPMRNGASHPGTPGRPGSPFTAPGSIRKYANGMPFSTTQAQAKWYEMEEELAAERRRTAKLSEAMDEMIREIENRGPELVELKGEQERLEEEVLNFSRMLDEANVARDGAVKDAQRIQAECHSKDHEAEILRQQLRDLSTQVKILLVELQSREEGLSEMSAEERLELERAARGELEDWSTNETFTNQFIAQRLVIFRNVEEMVSQNTEQLRLLHELGERLEGQEAQEKAHESATFANENEQLKEQLVRYRDELKSTNVTIESYAKERDMFRRMLQHRGQLPQDSDMQALFGQSVPPATPQRGGMQVVPPTPRSKEVEELNTLLKQHQAFFDQFRNESSVDRKSLQDQVDGLSRDKGTLQSELAHWKSQKVLADERQAMFQSNFTALRNENDELQRRGQLLSENAAKQDLRTQQVAEELVEARSMAESLRNDNANVRAEKDLWKRIETRLTDDNKTLMDERSRLNKLVADLQNLQNERELSDSETRRRLQSRIEVVETELAETKKKLEQEVEDSRKTALRREYEEGQSRNRVDDLVKSLGNVREELVAAKTTRDQLQVRVDEMKIELRAAEERAAALQPRPTPRAQSAQAGEPQGESDEELTIEQRLTLEASELRRDLDLARNELESAKEQIESYKAIAQSTEEELANFNETSEQYKEENDRILAERDGRVKELEQKVEDLSSELTTSNTELSELRSKSDDSNRVLNEQKASYEMELARMKDDAERHAEEKKLYQEDLKAQAEIAQQAQQSYENELLKHADAAKGLQSVRKEYNDLRTEVAGIRAEAEAAKVSLEQGEESWAEQKERFERELDEAKRRRQDVDQQNELLHRQMDSFSAELTALRSGRTLPAEQHDENPATTSGDSSLQEVIKYLRREKEIVDVQYELSMQEAKRLQQQLDYANDQLEEATQKLAEERRQANEKSVSEGNTTKLMQTINELNLYRESATTLRNEARQNREKLEAKTVEVERLVTEIEPLKARVGELEGDLEGKDGELKLLQDDRDHWRERTQNIISKYDRVDPAELEEMKKKIEDLNVEKESLLAEQNPLKEQLEEAEKAREGAVQEATKSLNNRLENYRNQAKEQNRRQVARIKELEAASETAKGEKTQLEEELAKIKEELEVAKVFAEQAQVAASADAEKEQQGDSSQEADHAELHARIAAAEANASEHSARAEALSNEVQTLQARIAEYESQISTLQSQLDNALQGEEGEVQEEPQAGSDTLDKIKQELAAAQQEVETLRTNAANVSSHNASLPPTQSAEGGNNAAEEVAQEVAKLRAELEEQHEAAKKHLTEQNAQRIESMKLQLRDKLKQEKEQNADTRSKLVEQHSQEIQKLKDEHEAAVNKLKEDHQAELDKLGQNSEKAQAGEEQPATTAPVTGDQMVQMIKEDPRVRGLFSNNLNKRITAETEKLNKTIAEKDDEISTLKKSLEAMVTSGGDSESNDAEMAELRKRLETAEQEKQTAIRQAVEVVEKKVKVQLNQRDIAQAKIAAVRKAAQDTPEKPVKEVWDLADKARPAPKPVSATITSSSPAAKSTMPSSPVPTTPTTAQTIPPVQGEEQSKIQQRLERFGAAVPTATFGQPSAPVTSETSISSSQPSQLVHPPPGTLPQPPRRASAAQQPGANPQAPAFTPAAGTGGLPRPPSAIPRGGGSGIPRGGARGGASAGLPQNPNINAAQRGGATASGIGRGAGRGGRGGRGAATNAGQKRQHEGGQAGDEKRMRGGAAGGSE